MPPRVPRSDRYHYVGSVPRNWPIMHGLNDPPSSAELSRTRWVGTAESRRYLEYIHFCDPMTNCHEIPNHAICTPRFRLGEKVASKKTPTTMDLTTRKQELGQGGIGYI